jgi:hypothetical protein
MSSSFSSTKSLKCPSNGALRCPHGNDCATNLLIPNKNFQACKRQSGLSAAAARCSYPGFRQVCGGGWVALSVLNTKGLLCHFLGDY